MFREQMLVQASHLGLAQHPIVLFVPLSRLPGGSLQQVVTLCHPPTPPTPA